MTAERRGWFLTKSSILFYAYRHFVTSTAIECARARARARVCVVSAYLVMLIGVSALKRYGEGEGININRLIT